MTSTATMQAMLPTRATESEVTGAIKAKYTCTNVAMGLRYDSRCSVIGRSLPKQVR